MAHQRLQRPDIRLEELRELRGSIGSPDGSSKDGPAREEERLEDRDGEEREVTRDTVSPEGSIEVDDESDRRIEGLSRIHTVRKRERTRSEEESSADQDSVKESSRKSLRHISRSDDDDATSTQEPHEELTIRLQTNVENVKNDTSLGNDLDHRRDLTIKIRLEETVDLSTKRNQDKENREEDLSRGQDLSMRRKEAEVSSESKKSRREITPPGQVWRPY